jgi:hypothetical protein
MAQCTECGAETHLYAKGLPLCAKCDQDRTPPKDFGLIDKPPKIPLTRKIPERPN